MDFSVYKNEKDIIEAEKELQSVDSSLSISSIMGGDVACEVGTFFPTKGNRFIINELKRMRWVDGRGSVDNGKRYTRMYKPLKKYKEDRSNEE